VFFGPLRETVGEKTVVRDTDSETVGGLLAELEGAYGLEGRLLDDDGAVAEIAVTLDGRHVQHIEGPDTPLADGVTLRMTPAVYGG